MAEITLGTCIAFTAQAALDAGNYMEASFLSARAGDLDGALDMAKQATAKALLAKKALSSMLQAGSTVNQAVQRLALGNVEDARLFAKAAMDVYRSTARRTADKKPGEAAKKSSEAAAFLIAGASALLDIRRGNANETILRKAALASERAAQAAEDAAKAGGAHGEDAQAVKTTAAEVARRAVWALKEATK